MFVQVLRGRVLDREGLMRHLETWRSDLSSGAKGWLGSTAGVTDDMRFIGSFRFETQEDAQRNSDRPEQTSWWNQMSKFMDTPRFWDCTDVDEYKQGGSDEAGFVQVIQGRVVDREAFREAARGLGDSGRADVIGGVVAWDSSRFTEFAYFTSEEEARKGEKAPPHTASLERIWPLTQDLEYFDLRTPWFTSPEPA
jgi:hypothetical protein